MSEDAGAWVEMSDQWTAAYHVGILHEHALWLNAMSKRERSDHDLRVAYWTEYIRQGCPRGFQWPIGD